MPRIQINVSQKFINESARLGIDADALAEALCRDLAIRPPKAIKIIAVPPGVSLVAVSLASSRIPQEAHPPGS